MVSDQERIKITDDKIKEQTKALSAQLQKLNKTETDEDYLRELEKYNSMLKEADFSPEAQASSKKRKRYDKAAPVINGITKQVDKGNKRLEEHNTRV